MHADVQRREQVEACEVPEPHEGEARRAARRGDGGECARVLERPARGTPARTDLPDAGASGRAKASAAPMISGVWIRNHREPRKPSAVPPSVRKMKKAWPEGQTKR